MISVPEKGLLGKKFKRQMLTSIQKTTLVRTNSYETVEEVERVKRKTKVEVELEESWRFL